MSERMQASEKTKLYKTLGNEIWNVVPAQVHHPHSRAPQQVLSFVLYTETQQQWDGGGWWMQGEQSAGGSRI